jgi:hypothetical protein
VGPPPADLPQPSAQAQTTDASTRIDGDRIAPFYRFPSIIDHAPR